MARQLQFRRLLWLTGLLLLAFLGLGFRLVQLQVIEHEKWVDARELNTIREALRQPKRGDIRDAQGNLLATSLFVKTVCADPVMLGSYQAPVARALAPLLGVEECALYQQLLPRIVRTNADGKLVTNRYEVLQRKVPPDTWRTIYRTMTNLPLGVTTSNLSKQQIKFLTDLRSKAVFAHPVDDQQRLYPNHQLAAHVLGFVSTQERTLDRWVVPETVGVEGIERSFDQKLRGVAGWRVTEAERNNRELVAWRRQDVEPSDGLHVVLTVDYRLQQIAEAALAEAMEKHQTLSASALVVRPRTGEILALTSLPTFDPNRPGAAPAEARRNRVITDVIEPGSTFKIVTVSAVLNEGLVTLADIIDCERKPFYYAGHYLKDYKYHGPISVELVLAKSSNIGVAKLGIQLGAQRLYEYMRLFGFGTPTGIPLPSESAGLVTPPERWYKISLAQIPMGHGVAVTPLQMVMAMSAIANGGVMMRPLLVSRLEDRTGRVVAEYPPQRRGVVIREDTARQMVQALKTAASPQGTAPQAMLAEYTVAGKTGTAQKPGPGGYQQGKYISSFIGFFPADRPELCIGVVLDEPKGEYYGGQTAAPVFRQIAERAAACLNIRPDLEPEGKPHLAGGPGHNSQRSP